MTTAVTTKIFVTLTSVELDLAEDYLLIGQRTHSNAKTPRKLRVIGLT
jgi:hypothetical protein